MALETYLLYLTTVAVFGALFPQFIDPGRPVLPQLMVLGSTYLVVDGVILLAFGWLGTRAATALRRQGSGLVNRVSGFLMIAAAALLASKDFSPRPQR